MFDPYHKWLGIPPEQQPPTLYQLLGISPREQDPEVIEEAAIRQTAHVRTYQNGPYAQECARLLGEIARARITLRNPAKRQDYDRRLAQSAEGSAVPAAEAANEFQFTDSPAPIAAPHDDLDTVPVESAISSLVRKHAGGSTVGHKLGLIVAIVLGGAIPVAGFLAFLEFKSPSVPTQPARRNAEVAQVNPVPKPTLRTTPVTPPTARTVRVKPAPADPSANTDHRDNSSPPKKNTNPVTNIPIVPPSEPTPAPVKKLPVPEAAKQAAAEKLIRDLFRKDYLAAKRPADKLTLAAKLMQQAEETKDDPAARFVLLREARDLATQAGDVSVALTAAEETIRGYEVEPLPLKLATLTAVGKITTTAAANKELAQAVLRVLDEALADDQFDTAAKLLAVAEPAARGAMSTALVSKVQARTKDLADRKQEAEAARKAADTLRRKPDDPLANLVAGKYLCFRKGKWEQGLPLLARGDDALAKLAKKDLAGPTEAATQAEVGDGWWSLAEAMRGNAEITIKGRANFWYQKALLGVTGFTQTRIDQRIKEYAAKTATQPSATVSGERARFTGHKDRVTCVAISANGSRAISGSADGTVILWDPETGQELQRLGNHQGEVRGVAISTDGTRAASGGRDGKAMYYILDNGVRRHSFLGFKSVECMTISSDGRSPLFGTTTGAVVLWGPEPGSPSGRWTRARGVVIQSVAFSPDGRLVLFAASDGIVRLWDPLTRKESRLATRLPDVRSVAFSPDGRQVLTAGGNRVIRLWEVRNGKEVRVFKGHTGRINSVVFTSDGNYLLSGSDDKTVRLWDAKTGRELHRYPWHTDKVTSVAVSGDGRLAISGSDDRTVRVWNLPK